jgi:hypothetical protein
MWVKVMSIHGGQLTPSSLRSHLAVMLARSGLIVSVDRTAPLASAAAGWATGATSPPPVNVHTLLVDPGAHDGDVAQVVVGAGGERIGGRVILADELQRLDPLLPDHHVNVVDQEEAASKPLVHIGSRDGDRNLAHDVAF